MNSKLISDAVSEIDLRFVDEALNYKKKAKMPIYRKWGTAAACFIIAGIIGMGVYQSELLNDKTDTAILDNGAKIIFVNSETASQSLDIAGTITTSQLTKEEADALFPGMSVTTHAVFMTNDTDVDNSQELIGFEGNIGNIKMVVSTSDIDLNDTVIEGIEGSNEIDGISVVAGYWVTDPNSKGERNVIYYASFNIGKCKVYLENAGAKDDSEIIKNQLAEAIRQFIENGEPDISVYIESKATIGSATY